MHPVAGDGAATRGIMGLTTPPSSAPHAGCNRFSHDPRQLGQLVQHLSYTVRLLTLHSIRIDTYPLLLPMGAGQAAARRDVSVGATPLYEAETSSR